MLNVSAQQMLNGNQSFATNRTLLLPPYAELLELQRKIAVVIYPILIGFGVFGNLLSFVVMRKGSLRNVSTCFYMSALAIADTGESSCILLEYFRLSAHAFTIYNIEI